MCSHVFTSSAGSLGGRHTSLVKSSSCCPALPCAGWVGCPAPLLKARWTGWLALTAFLHMCAVLGIRSGAADSRAPSPPAQSPKEQPEETDCWDPGPHCPAGPGPLVPACLHASLRSSLPLASVLPSV